MPLPKLRIRSRRGSLVRTSREVCDRTLLRVVLTELGTNPTGIGLKRHSASRKQVVHKLLTAGEMSPRDPPLRKATAKRCRSPGTPLRW